MNITKIFFGSSLIRNWPKVLALFLFIILFSAYVNIFAVFTPGQTLDPNCAPGTSGCVVSSASSGSQWATSGSDIYFTGGNVGVGTNSPTNSLTVNGGALFGHGSINYKPGLITKNTFSFADDTYIISFITSGNYAYVLYSRDSVIPIGSENTNGVKLAILDISNPDNISLVSEVSDGLFLYSDYGRFKALDISGNYLYINGSDGVLIYNISDKNNPTYLKTISKYNVGYAYSLNIHDNKMYVTYDGVYNEENGFSYNYILIYDITDKENPVYLNEITDTDNPFFSLYVTNNYIYATGNGFNIYNSSTLDKVGGVNVSGAIDLDVVNNYAYITSAGRIKGGTFYIYDISNPSSPVLQDSIDTANREFPVVVSGNYAYVGDSEGGDTLYMFDVSDPTDIKQTDYVVNDNIKNISGLSFNNGNIYVIDPSVSVLSVFSVGQKAIYGNSINATDGVAIGSYAGVSSASNGGLIISGNVGIGTDNPTSKLSIKLGEGESDALTIFTSGSGGLNTLNRAAPGDNIYFNLNVDENSMILGGVKYYLPGRATSSDQVLMNDGGGELYWGTPSSDNSSPISAVVTYGLSTSSWGAGSANYSNFLGYFTGYQAYYASSSNFLGMFTGYQAYNASWSNFFGEQAGYSAGNANHSNFLGYLAGYNATNASNSNFLGQRSGYNADNAYLSNLLGYQAGESATNASNSNFFGQESGYNATNASLSNFIGTGAGSYATNASNSNFIGTGAGSSASGASNSIFIGKNSGTNDTVNNTANTDDFSILIGQLTNTGGFSNSIAIGGSATNTASNQFMIGSTTRPINTTVWKGTSATATLDTSTGLITTSDERLKTNIVDLPDDTLSKLVNVRTVTFNWLNGDNDKTNIGFLAQDLQTYFPELVYENADGYFGVNYANMTPVLTEAIKELNLKVKGIGDLTKENDFRDSIIAWFADFNNGITSLFSKEIHTEKICAKRSDGTEYCVNGDDLDRVFGTGSTEINVTSSAPITPVVTNENAPSETGDIPDANQKVPAVVVPETVSSENITTVESGSSIKPESEPEPKPQTPTEVTPVDSSASLQTKPE